ncbi:MAG: hypothetical protein R2745_06680 [Vicinamibacterales bacterium]
MTARAAVALLALVLASPGCGRSTRSSPTGPSPDGPWTGTWSGTVADPANGTGTIRLTIDDYRIDATRSFFVGTWTTSFGEVSRNAAGTLAGGTTGGTGVLTLTPVPVPPCATPPPFPGAVGSYTAPALTLDGDTIRGSYQFGTCTSAVPGTIELRR